MKDGAVGLIIYSSPRLALIPFNKLGIEDIFFMWLKDSDLRQNLVERDFNALHKSMMKACRLVLRWCSDIGTDDKAEKSEWFTTSSVFASPASRPH